MHKAHTRWLPDKNSSSASHVATDREGCLWDRKVSPWRSVRWEREDRNAIGWKRKRERTERRRRYWIGDTAWGLGIVAVLTTCPKAFVARSFRLIPRSSPNQSVSQVIGSYHHGSKRSLERRHHWCDHDVRINSVLILEKEKELPICALESVDFSALKRGRRDVTSSETRKWLLKTRGWCEDEVARVKEDDFLSFEITIYKLN